MTTATQTTPIPTCTPANRGMVLPCPLCGCEEAVIDLNLAVDPFDEGEETLHCQECDTAFSALYVRDLMRKWARVLAWLDTMPGDDAE